MASHTTTRSKPSQGELVEQAAQRLPAYPMIDIGVNLMDRSFDKDREAVVDRAVRAGCGTTVITGSCLRSAAAAAAFAEQHSRSSAAQQQGDGAAGGVAEPGTRQHGEGGGLYFTAGVHPHNAKHCDASTIAQLERLASHPLCVAVGECGLDFNRNFSPPDVQQRWCAQQVQLAERLGMPLFLHCREAYPQLEALLRQHHRGVPVVVHCFTGGREDLERMLARGYYIGITGWVCDDRPEKGAEQLAELLPLIPDNRLLIETDAPYLTPRTIKPSKLRPHRNEPALLGHVLERVAAARGQAPEHVAALTTQNAREFFRLG